MGNSNVGQSCHYCKRPAEQVKLKECPLCRQLTCKVCLENPVLMEEDRASLKVKSLCRSCFKQNVSLDFSKTFEIVGESHQNTLIWLHGGGSCRTMFMPHAQFLAEKGFRSILVDLPGHGTLMDEKLTLENCKQTIHSIRKKHCQIPPILIGGSFGGYLIMELMKDYPEQSEYQAAVIMMCGQNVGEGRSWKASLGLWGMGKAINYLSSETLVNGLIKSAKHVDKEVLADMMRAGYYFQQGDQQVEMLKNSAPESGLKKFEGPVLFINGSEDHRDSEQRWLKACKRGQLKVYQGADHFFSHDKRFMERLFKDLHEFVEKSFGLSEGKSNNITANTLHEGPQ